MLATIVLGLILVLVLLVFGLMYSPPSSWIGRGKKDSDER